MKELMKMPVVGAPLAGGPSTPALAAAVSGAGGLGFLAAGYKTAAAVERDLAQARALTSRPLGLNIFFPVREQVDERELERYAERMRAEGERYGVVPGEPRWTDDDWDAKLELVLRTRPEVVSFAFGCPGLDVIESLRNTGCQVWCTVTSVAEAKEAVAAGVDALVVQGAEAGGHQGSFHDHDDEPRPLLELLAEIGAQTSLPLVAAGGIADGRDIATVLGAGAVAAQIGSAFLLTPEAGTSQPHRHALQRDGETTLTRAFSGRRARGIVNRFLREHDAVAPCGYPEIHYVTAPIRAAARAAGDVDGINLWAGTAFRRAEARPAAELVTRWAAGLAVNS